MAVAVTTGCATRGATPRPFPGAPVPEEPAAVRPDPPALVATALMLRGTPYRNGGSDPKGFDCSGFVQWVFGQHGRALPREVQDQFRVGASVDRRDVRPGDLLFFQTVSPGASHVGIALDGDQFVHAPSSRGVVRVERHSTAYWSSRWVGARRVV
jgi:cell wall-associated NlpC family hydrolase